MSDPDPGAVSFSCTCGALQGHLTSNGVKRGTHVACFCNDCRAAQLYFKQPDPAPGPVDIFQTTPEEICIQSGREHLAAMQLGPKGMIRWYAGCCGAPLATTPQTGKFPFAGFDVKRLDDPSTLGPITTRGFVPQPGGKQKHEMLRYAAFGLLNRFVRSRLSGNWRTSQFFLAQTAAPTVKPTILTKDQRAALYR